MQQSSVSFSRSSAKSFDDLVTQVQEKAAGKGFRTLYVHDVQATLVEKGFDIGPYKIVEVCNAGFAHQVIGAYPDIGMFLPCRIAVYDNGNERVMTMMNPSVMSTVLPEAQLGDIPLTVEQTLQAVIEDVTT